MQIWRRSRATPQGCGEGAGVLFTARERRVARLNDAGMAENLIFSRPRAGRHLPKLYKRCTVDRLEPAPKKEIPGKMEIPVVNVF